MILYHGTSERIDQFDPKKTIDGGLHFGSVEQARMRCKPGGNIVKVEADVGKIQKSRDTGGNWRKKIESAKSKGYQGICYLNRYEGISIESILKAEEKGIDPDRLNDTQFKKHFPEAEESYILFNPECIKILGQYQVKDHKASQKHDMSP